MPDPRTDDSFRELLKNKEIPQLVESTSRVSTATTQLYLQLLAWMPTNYLCT